jgi:hypothetical protein
MLNFIKPATFKWWQLAIYETALLSLGIIIGSKYHDFLTSLWPVFGITFAVGGSYIGYLWFKQQDGPRAQ